MKALILAALTLALLSCTDRQHRNPLDPLTTSPEFSLDRLEVVAGDRRVGLRWSFSQFDDVTGFQLYRRSGDEEFRSRTTLAATVSDFVDSEVENGTTYDYRLALQVENEGEIFLEGFHRATPGEEVCWVGDDFSGTIWRISPDSRSAQFGRSGFADLQGIGLDQSDGSLWVASGFFAGLLRVPAKEGEPIGEYPASIGEPSTMVMAPVTGVVWMIDAVTGEVAFGAPTAGDDSLRLAVVDAHFLEPVALSARGEYCWIADRREGRVLRVNRIDTGRLEFRDLQAPIALSARDGREAWVLTAEGTVLAKLAEAEPVITVELPFVATALDVDPETGSCWVVGGTDLAEYSVAGELLLHQPGIIGGQSIRLDPVHGNVWLGGSGRLAKFDFDGRALSELGGFSRPQLLLVDPRGASR